MPAPADAHAVPEPSQWENRQLFLVGANQKRPSYQRSEDDYDVRLPYTFILVRVTEPAL